MVSFECVSPLCANSSTSGKRNRVLAVVVLCGVLAGCNRSAGQPPASQQAQAPPLAAALPDSARPLLGWLPADNGVPGWLRAGQPRHFGPGTLWEHIDGAAETYLGFGFEELVTVDYTNAATGLQVTVDLYRMSDAVGAFGIYAQETNPAAEFLAVGAEGYLNGTALNLWAGSCYAKLTSGKDHPSLAAALRALAADIGTRIGADAKRPVQFDRFPTVGLVAHSFKVVPKDVLGQSFLTGGFEAEYGTGKAAWRLTLIPFEGAEKATAALTRYREFLLSNGRVTKALSAPVKGGFVAQDSYYGLVVAARSGAAIAVALGPPSEQSGLDMVTRLLK